jgi:hypothetical protein
MVWKFQEISQVSIYYSESKMLPSWVEHAAAGGGITSNHFPLLEPHLRILCNKMCYINVNS